MNEIRSLSLMDLHVHSALSHDGQGSIAEYCEAAARQGMRAIGFCEHLDLDPDDVYCGRHDYERYRAEIGEARAKWGDRLTILMGAEVGFVPRIKDEIAAFLSGHAYDYVVGSVHAVFDGKAGVSEEYDALETFARYEFMDLYLEYFETMAEMVKSGLFDVVGHLDLIQRFGVNYRDEPLEYGRFFGPLKRILEGAVKRQMPIEINTSGLRQAPRATYPPREILRLYRELNGEWVVVGSDAHSPAELGQGIPVALRLARETGLDNFALFHDRIPEVIAWGG